MPNWCDNQIKISGSEASISAIKSTLDENKNGGLFDVLVGHLPDGVTEEEYQKNWYDLNCDRWGCKWDVDIEFESMEFEDDCIYMNIQTAWSPCNGFLRLLSEKYGVDVENNYSESGNDFAGVFTIADGNESDECYEYLEGLYHIDYDTFISEAMIQLEWMAEDGNAPEFDEWIDGFEYVENKEDLIELYNEIV
jgi:hypothetical protein